MKFGQLLAGFTLGSLLFFNSVSTDAQQITPRRLPLPQQTAPQQPPVNLGPLPDPWATDKKPAPPRSVQPAPQPQQSFTNAPQTPEEIADYLKKMRRIIDAYNGSVAAILQNPASVTADPSRAAAAIPQTQHLAAQINVLTAPKELAVSHAKLAAIMADVDRFISDGTASLNALFTATSLIARLQPTFDDYHQGVRQVMRTHNIDSSLDPFAGEDDNTKSQFASGMNQFQSNKANSLSGGASGAPGSTTPGGMSGTGDLFGGADMSAVTNMLGGGSGMSDLFKGSGSSGSNLFGNQSPFGSPGGSGSSGKFGSSGAGSAAADGDSSSNTDPAGGADTAALINTLQKLMGGSNGSLNGLLGQ